MITTYYIIAIAVLAIASATLLTLFLSQRRRNEELHRVIAEANEATAKAETELSTQTKALLHNIEQERIAREAEQMARVKAETELEAERRSIADKVRSQEELQQSLKEQFRRPERKAEAALYVALASVAETTPDEIRNLPPADFFRLFKDIAEQNDVEAFFGYVSDILTKKS